MNNIEATQVGKKGVIEQIQPQVETEELDLILSSCTVASLIPKDATEIPIPAGKNKIFINL